MGYFSIDPATGLLYQVREVDREALEIEDDTFHLEVEARQMDNPLKADVAQVKKHRLNPL